MTRYPDKASQDVAELHALLDQVHLAHVGLMADGFPLVIPTGIARDGDRVLVHGSTGSRWMRQLAEEVDACVSVTSLDAVVVARSAFESSFHYRSAVLFGRFTPVAEPEKAAALEVVIEALIPGRSAEVRPSTERELAATLVLAMPLEQWSLRLSHAWPDDENDDVAGPSWAGVVPVRTAHGHPLAAPDLREGIDVPPSVLALTGDIPIR